MQRSEEPIENLKYVKVWLYNSEVINQIEAVSAKFRKERNKLRAPWVRKME